MGAPPCELVPEPTGIDWDRTTKSVDIVALKPAEVMAETPDAVELSESRTFEGRFAAELDGPFDVSAFFCTRSMRLLRYCMLLDMDNDMVPPIKT